MSLPNLGSWRLMPAAEILELATEPPATGVLPPDTKGALRPNVVSRERMQVHASGVIAYRTPVGVARVPVDVVCPLDRWLEYPTIELFGDRADIDEILVD